MAGVGASGAIGGIRAGQDASRHRLWSTLYGARTSVATAPARRARRVGRDSPISRPWSRGSPRRPERGRVPSYSGEIFNLIGQSVPPQLHDRHQWFLGLDGAVRPATWIHRSRKTVFLASSAIATTLRWRSSCSLPAARDHADAGAVDTLQRSCIFSDTYAFTDSPQNLKYRSNVAGIVYVHRF
jgi:hypothetical protein